uniref:DNA damage inducible transcript 3 n=1 Tax=Salvator merianae TaxID=96440 RepID=A0A8D0B525_SALMN
MMAESLPFSMGTQMPTWELEAWYEDLEEVLSLDVTNRTDPSLEGQVQEELESVDSSAVMWNLESVDPLDATGNETAGNCELDLNLTEELLELLGEEPPGLPESDCSHSSTTQTGTDDDERASTSCKRKRCGQSPGGKRQRGREREQENARRVAELTAHNQYLQQEIERLSAEVEATRAALIQRMVSLKTQ